MFFWLLFSISVLPYVLVPLVFAGKLQPNTEQVRQTVLFLANAHIAITAYLYIDQPFRKILRSNQGRYVYGPFSVILLSALTYALTPGPYQFIWWAAYIFWQNWHFGRQTFGAYAIVTMDQTPGIRVSRFERSSIYATIFAGSIGALYFATPGSVIADMSIRASVVCGYVTAVLLVIGVAYTLYSRKRFNWNRALFFVFSLSFFAPQYINHSVDVGFTTYSLSHSFQYLFLMTVVAFNSNAELRRDRWQLPSTLVLVFSFLGIILVGGAILTIRGDFGTMLSAATGNLFLGKFLTGAMFGLVVAHFVIDAHAWRLREKPQREFVLGRFNFLAAGARKVSVIG